MAWCSLGSSSFPVNWFSCSGGSFDVSGCRLVLKRITLSNSLALPHVGRSPRGVSVIKGSFKSSCDCFHAQPLPPNLEEQGILFVKPLIADLAIWRS